MDWRIVTSLLVVVTCLSACAGTSEDPRQGGLMGGLQGIYGGTYDKRIQERNDQLAVHQRLHQDLEVQSVSLTKEYQLTDAKLATEKQQVAELEKGVQALAAQVAGQRAQSSRQQKEAAGLKAKITQLQKKIREQHNAIDDLDRSGGSEADPARYQALQADRDQLGQEYKALMRYHQESDPPGK